MTDPKLLSIISVIFAMMSAYSLYTGSRQMRDARRAGQPIRWYKHLNLLTGIEYTLLTFVFLLRLANLQGTIAPGMRGLVEVLYFVLLIPAALIAGIVIYRVILNARGTRASRSAAIATAPLVSQVQQKEAVRVLSKREQEEQAQRQRERRKKAAAARRRRAGRA